MNATPPSRGLKPPPKLGILGGGQLAAMLADGARELGLDPTVFASSPDEPAARMAKNRVVVGTRALGDLTRFVGSVDYLAIDQELDGRTPLRQALTAVQAEKGFAPTLVPSLDSLELCSDKLRQKIALDAANIPTPRWIRWNQPQDSAQAWLASLQTTFAAGVVLKLAHGGYDGRGTLIIKPEAFTSAQAKAAAFCAQAAASGTAVYAEELVPFTRELAVVATRWRDGRLAAFPAVVTRQDGGVCAEVRGPAAPSQVSPDSARTAEEAAARIGAVLDLVGTYAVEFFLTAGGSVLVNEIAPRVHNSGHFSLDASSVSQFAQHWRAVLDLDPRQVTTKGHWGMVNVLGHGTFPIPPANVFRLEAPRTKTYWYGKLEARPGRKLGHVNVTADSPEELEARLKAVADAIAQWHQSLSAKV